MLLKNKEIHMIVQQLTHLLNICTYVLCTNTINYFINNYNKHLKEIPKINVLHQ